MEENTSSEPPEQLLDQAIDSGRKYLEGALPEIRALGDEFYRQPDAGTWQKFAQFTEGLDWIMRMLHSVAANREIYFNGDAYLETGRRLSELLGELNDAAKDGDMVLTGDLILYEFAPVLENLKGIMDETAGRKAEFAS